MELGNSIALFQDFSPLLFLIRLYNLTTINLKCILNLDAKTKLVENANYT